MCSAECSVYIYTMPTQSITDLTWWKQNKIPKLKIAHIWWFLVSEQQIKGGCRNSRDAAQGAEGEAHLQSKVSGESQQLTSSCQSPLKPLVELTCWRDGAVLYILALCWWNKPLPPLAQSLLGREQHSQNIKISLKTDLIFSGCAMWPISGL